MVADQATFRGRNVPTALYSFLSTGDKIRDWSVEVLPTVFFPYVNFEIASLDHSIHALRYMWPSRTALGNRPTFSAGTYVSDDRPWCGVHNLSLHPLDPTSSIDLSDLP